MNMPQKRSFDYVVIGGGTAGAIMAARLSEQAACFVLLVEAGRDYPDASTMPAALRNAHAPVMDGHNWEMQAVRRQEGVAGRLAHWGRVAKVFEVASNRMALLQTAPAMLKGGGDTLSKMNYPLGKVMGGGSSVNGTLALHGREDDFNHWGKLGNNFWNWEHVSPEIERFARPDGARLALPIEIAQRHEYTQLQQAFYDSCASLGFVEADEQGVPCGLRALPRNVLQGRRISTAELYLSAARMRPNLTIWSECHVDKFDIGAAGSAMRAHTVEVIDAGGRHRIEAGHVVLSAGAIHSPAILMRSGIGAEEDVKRAGIKPRVHVPGVGKNLADHPFVAIWGVPKAGAFEQDEAIHQLMLEHRSSTAERRDLQLLMLSAVPTAMFPPLGDFVGAEMATGISVMLSAPKSLGHVELVDADPFRAPRIFLNLLQDERDARAMAEGVRLAWRILQSSELSARLERFAMWNQAMIDSDSLIQSGLQSTVRASWHPAGTLRMGTATDDMAVVSQYGSLHACENVTVADASIMPSIPGVPTNLTCMLIAERLAGILKKEGEATAHRSAEFASA